MCTLERKQHMGLFPARQDIDFQSPIHAKVPLSLPHVDSWYSTDRTGFQRDVVPILPFKKKKKKGKTKRNIKAKGVTKKQT